jgi:hypothetical protein
MYTWQGFTGSHDHSVNTCCPFHLRFLLCFVCCCFSSTFHTIVGGGISISWGRGYSFLAVCFDWFVWLTSVVPHISCVSCMCTGKFVYVCSYIVSACRGESSGFFTFFLSFSLPSYFLSWNRVVPQQWRFVYNMLLFI